jgi:hypothetical protein
VRALFRKEAECELGQESNPSFTAGGGEKTLEFLEHQKILKFLILSFFRMFGNKTAAGRKITAIFIRFKWRCRADQFGKISLCF